MANRENQKPARRPITTKDVIERIKQDRKDGITHPQGEPSIGPGLIDAQIQTAKDQGLIDDVW